MSPTNYIADKFRCSELAAREICNAALVLARAFVAVHDAYDLTHVLDAKRATRKVSFEYSPSKAAQGGGKGQGDMQQAERIRLSKKALSRPTLNLFECAEAAIEAQEKFRTALNLANCKNYPGLDEALSMALSALHDAGQLPSPENVGDGRLAYESMRRDYLLLQSLGILKTG